GDITGSDALRAKCEDLARQVGLPLELLDRCPRRQPPTSGASPVSTNGRTQCVNSTFPQATWGARAVDGRRCR
ncbi:hypothetical protein AB0N43_27960, partial [Streptomyces pseudogriseolus]|uniref:hypothetical protein n=1 Tax=Streptomyces pseudogriseolus TaxID=36817 RepID=UPI00347DA1C2